MSDSDTAPKAKILWDGDVVIAIDKPAGLATQSPPGIVSLETVVRDTLGDRTGYLAFPHRLDRPVSGVILVALQKKAARLLSDQFAARKIEKKYLAWVTGRPLPSDGIWSDAVRKIPNQARVEIVGAIDPDGKVAETQYRFLRFDADADRTLVELMPRTGRMHQLRVQTAHHGHPIVGDPIYGENCESTIPDNTSPENKEAAMMLRAHEITFHDPRNGRRVTVTAPCTQSFD